MERHLTGPSQRVQGKSPQQSGVTNLNFKTQSAVLVSAIGESSS